VPAVALIGGAADRPTPRLDLAQGLSGLRRPVRWRRCGAVSELRLAARRPVGACWRSRWHRPLLDHGQLWGSAGWACSPRQAPPRSPAGRCARAMDGGGRTRWDGGRRGGACSEHLVACPAQGSGPAAPTRRPCQPGHRRPDAPMPCPHGGRSPGGKGARCAAGDRRQILAQGGGAASSSAGR
jgi:hypothetical protein